MFPQEKGAIGQVTDDMRSVIGLPSPGRLAGAAFHLIVNRRCSSQPLRSYREQNPPSYIFSCLSEYLRDLTRGVGF